MFKCNDSNDTFDNKVCVSPKSYQTDGYRKFAIKLDQCNAHEKCEVDNLEEKSTCKSYSYKEKDQDCTVNEECLSSNCNKKCTSLAPGDQCFADGDCPNGFFCGQVDKTLTFNCVEQVKEGEKCYSDYDCKNNLGCLNNVCTKYYSLIEDAPSSNAQFCLSGEVQEIDKVSKCTTLTAVETDSQCKPDQTQCNYTNKASAKFTKDCTCSLSNLFNKYCPMASDKSDWKNTVSQLITYYNKEALTKHTLNRHKYSSALGKKKYETFNYPVLLGADTCAVSLFTNTSFIQVSLALILLVLMMFQ